MLKFLPIFIEYEFRPKLFWDSWDFYTICDILDFQYLNFKIASDFDKISGIFDKIVRNRNLDVYRCEISKII